MTKQQEFLNFWKYLTHDLVGEVEVPPNVKAYIDALDSGAIEEKSLFTTNGASILSYLQNQPKGNMFKAREIAEGMGVTSKMVSGAMRKLVTDGYVEKIGKDPVIYTITDKGLNVEIKGENE